MDLIISGGLGQFNSMTSHIYHQGASAIIRICETYGKMEVLFFHAVRHVTGRVTSGSRLTGPDRRNSIYQDACYASDETWNHPGGLKEEFSVGAAIFAHEFRAAG